MFTRRLLVPALVTFSLGVAIAACGPPSRSRGDSGSGGDGGSAGQGGSGGGVGGSGGTGGGPAGTCSPGNTVCDSSNRVRECDAMGNPGSVLQDCMDEVCSNGRCTTPACSEAENRQSVVGCLFYGYDTDNTAYDDTQVFGFPVGNDSDVPVAVKVERKTGADTWEMMVEAMVMPHTINYLRIAKGPAMGNDHHIEGTGQEPKAYRIQSDGPIVAYQINADDENGASGNSGSTILMPFHTLGRHYYAITPKERGAMVGGFGGATGSDHAFIAVVAARNQTKVKIKVAGATMAGGVVPALGAGEEYEAVIDEGDVLQVETDGKDQDLTGSEITTDKPAIVFAGSVCGGFEASRLTDCDHIEEQMFPTTTWGKSFVVLDMRMPMHGASNEVWAVMVASEDGTEIRFDSAEALTGLPSDVVTLDRGQSFQVTLNEPIAGFSGTPYAHYTVEASKPIGIVSYMGTQEGGAWVVPVDQFLDNYLVSAHPWFTGYLMVTRTAGTPVTLDGMPMSDSVFKPAGGGFEVSYVAMTRCDTMPETCGHSVEGAKVGTTLTANGGVCNYCYAGGAGARCVNKTAGCR